MKNLFFLAQNINTIGDLHNAIVNLLGIVVDIAYLYAVIVLIMSLTQERGDGSWKFGIVRSFGIFAAVAICNIILNIFFPGQQFAPTFS